MEGIFASLLCGVLCVGSTFIGIVIFVLLNFIFKKLTRQKLSEQFSWISPLIALVIALFISIAFFYKLFAPTFPDYYTPKRQPNAEDLIGVWAPRPDTLELIEEFGYSPRRISLEFRANGEFVMTNMPDKFINRREMIHYSGSGTWQIARGHQGDWGVQVNFTALSPPYFPDPPRSGSTPCPGASVPCDGLDHQFDLWNREPPFVLAARFIGHELDPDFYFVRAGDVHE
jgi:energy-coupling factor transporter transmembrane protein EcfT